MQELKNFNPLINNILKIDSFNDDKPYSFTEDCDVFGFCLDQNVYREWESGTESDSIFKSMIRNENWNNPGGVSLMFRTFHITNQFSSFSKSEFGVVNVDKLRDSMKEYQVDKLVERSKLFLEKHQVSSAIKSLDTAIQMIPKSITALKYRAHIYIQCGNFSDAKNDLIAILSESPEDMEALKLWTALPNSLTSYDTMVNNYLQYTPTMHRLSASLESKRKVSLSDSSTSSSSDSVRSRDTDDSCDSKSKKSRRRHKKRRKSKHKRKDKSKRVRKSKKDVR